MISRKKQVKLSTGMVTSTGVVISSTLQPKWSTSTSRASGYMFAEPCVFGLGQDLIIVAVVSLRTLFGEVSVSYYLH